MIEFSLGILTCFGLGGVFFLGFKSGQRRRKADLEEPSEIEKKKSEDERVGLENLMNYNEKTAYGKKVW